MESKTQDFKESTTKVSKKAKQLKMTIRSQNMSDGMDSIMDRG